MEEHDELDVLDGPSYACLAQGVPPAMRASVLGDKYLLKLANLGVKLEKQTSAVRGSAKGGKDKSKNDLKRPKTADGQQGMYCTHINHVV